MTIILLSTAPLMPQGRIHSLAPYLGPLKPLRKKVHALSYLIPWFKGHF